MKPQLRLSLALALAGLVAVGTASAEPNFAADTPPPLDTRPVYPPPPAAPQSDRKDGNGAAIAMAAVGAALSGASCAMLFADANKAEQRGESSHAAMLRGQAMQQCAQAAQNMASALQNNKGKDAMSDQQPGQPKFAELPQGETKKATETASNSPLPTGDEKKAPGSETQTVDPVQFKGVDEKAFDGPSVASNDPGVGPDVGIGNGVKPLPPIDRAAVTFDDKSKGEGTTPQTPLGASSSAVGAGALPSNSKGLTGGDMATGEGDGKAQPAKRLRFSGAGGGGDSDGGGHVDSGSSSGGSFDLSSFMAQLQGAPGAKPAGAETTAQQVTALGGAGKQDGPPITIFQFASFRYRKAWRDDGLVGHYRREIAAAPKKSNAQAKAAPPKTEAKPKAKRVEVPAARQRVVAKK